MKEERNVGSQKKGERMEAKIGRKEGSQYSKGSME